MKFYVQTPQGKSLGVIEAEDANVAQHTAGVMWGFGRACFFPPSHIHWADRIMSDLVQSLVDLAE